MGSIVAMRDFVRRAEQEIPPPLGDAAEPRAIELVLDLRPDEDIDRALDAEWSRIGRKLRWRKWTGLDADAR